MSAIDLEDIKRKVYALRVTDLHEVITKLRLSKRGRKTDLQRIVLEHLGLEGITSHVPAWKIQMAVNVINEVYNGLKGQGKSGYGNGRGYPHVTQVTPRDGTGVVSPPALTHAQHPSVPVGIDTASGKKIRCWCLNPGLMPDMIQCSNPRCGVLQHRMCVKQSHWERHGKDDDSKDENYYCEQCRLVLSDPFWKPVEQITPARKLVPTPGCPPVRDMHGKYHTPVSIDQTFFLNGQQYKPCHANPKERRIQISCIKVEDEVPFRFHWPKNLSVRINGLGIRAYGRSLTTELGINQRDKPIDGTQVSTSGPNTLKISALEHGSWIIMVHIAALQSVEQVKQMMMTPETKEEAKDRMIRWMSPDHDGVGLEQVTLSLKDPMSCLRIKQAVRFEDASDVQAFDLDSFLSIVEMNKKWQDPNTLRNSNISNLRMDGYVNAVLKCLEEFTNIDNVEVNSEGKWKPEGSTTAWFDICEAFTDDNIQEIKTLWDVAQEAGENGSGQTQVTTELADTDKVDPNIEAMEAMSALVNVNGAPACSPSKIPGIDNNLKRKAAADGPSGPFQRSSKASKEPEVIDLVSDSD